MARRLPWATGADTVEAAKPKRTAVQRGRYDQPVSSDEDLASKAKPHQTSSPMKSPSKARVRKRETSRTPSTSPPPAPPLAELMHEGYHADDIFMMVEDEFQTVAQSFTHHLHHAEYVRMKKKARAAPPPASTKPLDGMPDETKKKLEAKDIHDRQNAAVKNMISRAGRASPDNEEEAQGIDPWQGTSLAGLMAKDNTQKRTALVGLEQIPSTTRAAKGFSRGEGDSPSKREEIRSVLEIYGGKNKRERTTTPTPAASIEDADQDDDLHTPPRMKPVLKHGKPKSSEIEKVLNKKACVDPMRPSNTLTVLPSPPDSRSEIVTKTEIGATTSRPSSRPSSGFLRRTINDFDNFHDEDSDEFSTDSKTIFNSTSKTRTEEKSTKEKDKKSRLNEIPTFLV